MIKKIISVLFSILALFILSACNNSVDHDLSSNNKKKISSVIEAAGLKVEGYSTAHTFGYQ